MYVSVKLTNIEDGHAFPVSGAHVSLAYEAPFHTWKELHAFKIRARALLQSHAEIGVWMEFRPAASWRSFFLAEASEGFSFIELVQELLPHGQPHEFELHMSFGRA